MSQEAQATIAKPSDSHHDQSPTSGDCRFVGREEFYQLAISSRQLLRCDDVVSGLRGLWDPASGDRFMIEEEKLYGLPEASPA